MRYGHLFKLQLRAINFLIVLIAAI